MKKIVTFIHWKLNPIFWTELFEMDTITNKWKARDTKPYLLNYLCLDFILIKLKGILQSCTIAFHITTILNSEIVRLRCFTCFKWICSNSCFPAFNLLFLQSFGNTFDCDVFIFHTLRTSETRFFLLLAFFFHFYVVLLVKVDDSCF